MLHMKGGGKREIATHLCLTLIIKELRVSIEQGQVITTQNILFNIVLVTLNRGSQLALSKITRIGDTKDDIECGGR